MKSKKPLFITVVSVFAVVAILMGVLFFVLGTVNNYYSNALKSSSFEPSSHSGYEKRSKSEIEPLAKVNFLIGSTKFKKRKGKTWYKLTFGQHLVRGDSIQVGINSKIELTLKNGKSLFITGFEKIRIDSSILSLDGNNYSQQSSGGNNEKGKISRLTGKNIQG
ncbi:MAG: hypothetical protein E3J78_07080 [Candidatus Cloacimonadota bacterium]|nr:MAG: hypothetical protein E3J78_07080 [Candidatus Cloacimonadota bacterium]